ncbi:MAG TPA: hypothetical protein VG796_16120 [Verrucomicrobiales bacterium]|nr:hypothetical protein [Verrucomicrobiales bacterium]
MPRPCEKCGGDFLNEGLGLTCRPCGRRWHPECSTGVKICPRCSRPLQSISAVTSIAENRISRRRTAWLAVPATWTGAWALTIFSLADGLIHLTSPHRKPFFLEFWWLAAVAAFTACAAFMWIKFHRRRMIGDGVIAAIAGMGTAILIMAADMRDAPETEKRALKLGPLAVILFGSTIATAIRWQRMPQR